MQKRVHVRIDARAPISSGYGLALLACILTSALLIQYLLYCSIFVLRYDDVRRQQRFEKYLCDVQTKLHI